MPYLIRLVFLMIFFHLCFATTGFSICKVCNLERSVIGGNEGWEMVKDKKGVKVSLRKTPFSQVKSFKSKIVLDVDLATTVGFLWDEKNYVDWMLMCYKIEILDFISKSEQITYMINNPPWPVSKRDGAMRRKIYRDPADGSVYIEMCSMPAFIPERKKHVRVPLLVGYGQVRPISENKVEVTYEMLVNPGGWIPVWVINMQVVATPFFTLRNIQKLAPFKGYEGFDLSFIPERAFGDTSVTESKLDLQ